MSIPDHDDSDDTIIGGVNTRPSPPNGPDEDTVITERPDGRYARVAAAPKPVHGNHAIQIGTHEPIPLDVPVYIGRLPSTPRITDGPRPRLVRVPSLTREISSTHVEIRQEGHAVVVTDLDSTNGTVVRDQNGVQTKLRQGESIVVVDGAEVDIGDDIRIDIVSVNEVDP